MASVTGRIKQIQQPRGGYLPAKFFNKSVLSDENTLHETENIHASLVGLAVDYLTRFMLHESPATAFEISLLGASLINQKTTALQLVNKIQGLDDCSIIAACQLVGFDVCYRSSPMAYKPIENIKPDSDTIDNIRIMVNRCVAFFEKYGPIVSSGFTFDGGYTQIVTSGDGDYCTRDTLWDIKVTKSNITSAHTLQILMYYIMGLHSVHDFFKDIAQLGFYNPRQNIVYLCSVSTIVPDTIHEVETNVIGYDPSATLPITASTKVNIPQPSKSDSRPKQTHKKTATKEGLTVSDICIKTGLKRNAIYQDIHAGRLIAHKKGNTYYIAPQDLEAYLQWRKNQAIFQLILCGLLAFFLILILCIAFR